MRFVTFSTASHPHPRPGLLPTSLSGSSTTTVSSLVEAPATVIDLAAAAKALGFLGAWTDSLLSLIEHQDISLPHCREVLNAFSHHRLPKNTALPLSEVTLHAPIPHPPSMRDGYAFRQHVESARKGRGLPMIPEFDQFPVFYFTNHHGVIGPGRLEVQPRQLQKLDFELEVAVVVGRAGKNIPASQADSHIFGYMIMNDWSARALQREEMQLSLGPAKGKDFATALGPVLVTRDELAPFAIPSATGERHRLSMKAFHNGEQVSEGNLADMTWTFAQILERASYGVWLRPGEVIGSGTVGTGCYMELNVTGKFHEKWIHAGDTFTLVVEQLGRLENLVIEAPETYERKA